MIDPILPNVRVRRVIFAIVLMALVIEWADVRLRASRGHADWIVYWTAAQTLDRGGDPYDAVAPNGDRYIYPPLFAVALMPLAKLSTGSAATVWYVLNVALLAAVYVCWRRLLVFAGILAPPRWLVVSATIAMALPVVSTLQGGQVSLLILFCAIAAFALAVMGDRPASAIIAGSLLALATCVKLYPGLLAFGIAAIQLLAARATGGRDRSRPFALLASFSACVFGGLFAVPGALLGWRRNLALLGTFLDRIVFAHVEMHAESTHNLGAAASIRTWLSGIGVDAGVTTLVWSAAAIVFGAVAGVAIFRLSRRGRPIDQLAAFSLVCVAALFYSPVAWHHHFVLLLPLAGAVPCLLLAEGKTWAAACVGAGVPAAVVAEQVLSALGRYPGPILSPAVATAAIVAAVALLRPVRSTNDARGLVAIAAD